jgi:hypothetical protein
MPVDLGTQTRDLFSGVDVRQLPIDMTEIMTLAESLPAADLAAFSEVAPAKPIQRRWWRNATAAAAAVAAVLLLVGGVAWLSRTVESTDPADQPPTTLAFSIPVPAPESLNRAQMEHQAEFLSAFQNLGFLGGGGCSGRDPGPYECDGAVYPPTLGGPVDFAFTVADQDSGGRDPGEVSGPDGMQQSSLYADAVREVAEDGLAGLYVWALATYPDDTRRLCQSGFTGDNEHIAWNPGYITGYECGAHLAGLLVQFSPTEALPAQQLPSSETGIWFPVPGALNGSDSETWDDTVFDLADTPFGIVGTSGQGLWISQDGIVWEPFARDSIQFVGGVSLARVAASDLGVVAVEPAGGSQAWHSADGTDWVEVQIPGFPQGVSARIAATDEAFVVAADGRIWRSTNGIDWVETVVDADVFNSGLASIGTLEATPFGFVAGGSEQPFPNLPSDTTNPRRNAIWHSDDGLSWTRATDLPGELRPTDEWINDVAGSELGVVAVTQSGAIWFSPDALNWTEVLPAPSRVSSFEHAVGASSTGFLIVSDDWSDGIEAQVSASVDGANWEVVGYVTPEGKYPAGDESGLIMREVIPLGNGFLIATEGGTSPVHIYKP